MSNVNWIRSMVMSSSTKLLHALALLAGCRFQVGPRRAPRVKPGFDVGNDVASLPHSHDLALFGDVGQVGNRHHCVLTRSLQWRRAGHTGRRGIRLLRLVFYS
jgi:hypothetical protein